MERFPFAHLAPDWGLATDHTADVEEIKLGDGYVLRRPKGINHLRQSWSPGYSNLTLKEHEDMVAWLRPRLNLTPFLWQHPTSKIWHQVVCTKLRAAISEYNICPVNFDIEEDFNPWQI